jgi:hypothetical protein
MDRCRLPTRLGVAPVIVVALLLAAGCMPQFIPPPTAAVVTVVVTVVSSPTPLPVATEPLEAATASIAVTVAASPTAVPAPATATRAPLPPTASPPTASPPTVTPVVAAAPTAIPSPGPSPTACPVASFPDFSRAWASGNMRQIVGCPASNGHSLTTSYEPFEHGFMFWRQDTRQVYVFYADGTWQSVADTYQDADPEYSCPDANTPSTTPPTPRRGFGKIWCTQSDVRSRLGNALHDEIGNTRPVQDFQSGVMLLIPERAGAPIALSTATGRWQQAP